MKERSIHLFDRIKTSKNLPSLPHILLKLIETCNREESTVKDISQIINKDSSLSAKVIKMVNSAYYGLSQRVPSIEQALVLLGIDAVKNICICASVNQAFSNIKKDSLFDLKVFWKHSLMCATIAQLIAKKALYPSPDEAFLSGLLHDIGRLVLWVNLPEEYADILKSSKDQPELILAGEARHGATHCEVGAWLINRWDLQSFMADAVLYHHESVDRIHNALPLVKIIYVANTLCPETDKEEPVKFGIAESIFRFEIPEAQGIIHQAEEEVREIALSLDIDIAPKGVPDRAVSGKGDEKQEDLREGIRDFSLLLGTLQNLLEAQDENAILKIVHQGLQVLFDIRDAFFFQYDSERNILANRGITPNEQNKLINEVVIPFQKRKSLLVHSLLQGEPFDSCSGSVKVGPTIIDQQLIRLIGSDGIMCLPMVAHNQYVGVLVFGTDKIVVSLFSKQIKLMMMFAKQAALALHTNGLRERQAKLILSERLTASSAIARKVFHEVNTPLSIIKNYIKVLNRNLVEGYSGRKELRFINGEVDRISKLIGELSDFSEPKIQTTGQVDINALLSELIRILQESHMIESNIKIHQKLDPSLPLINMDKNRLKQIFINLIKNAVEAMPRGGNIHLSTRFTSNNLTTGMNLDKDFDYEYLAITIRDDGPGVPENLESRLFEPFITSKGAGHAGLGLSIVYNTVKELNGTITYSSDPPNGTRFKVVFPVSRNQKSKN